MPFGDMLRQLQATDVHPPLHAAILWVTVRAVGSSELAIRLPSIVAGTLVVPMLYLAGRELFDRRTGLIAAVLGAAFPLAVWYSQEARMYSLYMLFTTVAVFAQARALRLGRVQEWTLYGVATAALLWTQYLSVLVVLAQQVVFAVAILKGRRAGASIKRVVTAWLGSLALAAVLLAPLLPYVLTQFGSYKHRGAGLTAVPSQAGSSVASQPGLSVYSVIANLIWAAGGYHADRAMEQLSALWPLGMVVALALLGRRRSWASNTLLTLVVLPLGGLFLIGLQRPDLFELRYVAGVVPVAALIVARGTTVLAPSKLAARVAMCGVVIVLLALLTDQQLNGANPRLYDFRGAVREVAAHARPGDQVLYSPVYLDAVVHYYGPTLHAEPIDGWRSAVRARGRIFVIGSFLEKRDISGHTGSVLAALEQRRRLVGRFTRPRIKVWEFE